MYDLNNENNIELSKTFANDECPPATQDISINLANREKAIKDAAYGPLNPAEPIQLIIEASARVVPLV